MQNPCCFSTSIFSRFGLKFGGSVAPKLQPNSHLGPPWSFMTLTLGTLLAHLGLSLLILEPIMKKMVLQGRIRGVFWRFKTQFGSSGNGLTWFGSGSIYFGIDFVWKTKLLHFQSVGFKLIHFQTKLIHCQGLSKGFRLLKLTHFHQISEFSTKYSNWIVRMLNIETSS